MHSHSRPEVRSRSRAVRAAAASFIESLETRRLFAAQPISEGYANPSATEAFGEVMVSRGDYVLIGRSQTADQVGAVTLIDATTGAPTVITKPDGQAGDSFGSAVTFVTDSSFAVSSFDMSSGVSKVFLFTIGNDQPAGEIVAPIDASFSWGNALAAVDGTLLVSDYEGGDDAGGVVYRYNTADQTKIGTYTSSDVVSDGYSPVLFFGADMAVDENSNTMLFSMQASDSFVRRVVEMNLAGDVVRNYLESGPNNTGSSFALGFAGDTVVVGDVGADRVSQFSRTVAGPGENTGMWLREIPGTDLGAAITTGVDTFTVKDSAGGIHVYNLDGTVRGVINGNASASIGLLSGNRLAVTDPSGSNSAGDLYIYDLATIGESDNELPMADAGPDQTVVRQQVVTFDGTGSTDDGSIVKYEWDLDGDGAFDDADTAIATFSYQELGPITVSLRVTDDQDAAHIATATVNVQATNTVGGTMFIGGTSGTDSVVVTQNSQGATVLVNGVSSPFAGNRIVILGGAGSDTIGVASNVTVDMEIHGGDGDDLISGGQGADVLIGDAGNDVLIGGNGRDLLIGGTGSDIILGMAADDILVAGFTLHDNDSSALGQISAIWNGADTYLNRVAMLKAGLLTTPEEADADNVVDVFDDQAIDILTGNGGTDWFLFNNDPAARDLILDRSSKEISEDVDAFVPPLM